MVSDWQKHVQTRAEVAGTRGRQAPTGTLDWREMMLHRGRMGMLRCVWTYRDHFWGAWLENANLFRESGPDQSKRIVSRIGRGVAHDAVGALDGVGVAAELEGLLVHRLPGGAGNRSFRR